MISYENHIENEEHFDRIARAVFKAYVEGKHFFRTKGWDKLDDLSLDKIEDGTVGKSGSYETLSLKGFIWTGDEKEWFDVEMPIGWMDLYIGDAVDLAKADCAARNKTHDELVQLNNQQCQKQREKNERNEFARLSAKFAPKQS